MAGIGGFRGVSANQDTRFSDKERKLLKSGRFPAEYSLPVDRKKVNWEVMKQWITKRVTELLGIEDEILVLFIIEECQNSADFDPKKLQIRFTSFLEKNTTLFMKELWSLLASASMTASGIPQPILDQLADELQQKKEIQDAINEKLGKERERRKVEEKVERAERRRAAEREEEERKEREARRRESERTRDITRDRQAREERATQRDGGPEPRSRQEPARDRARDRDKDKDRERHMDRGWDGRVEGRSRGEGDRERHARIRDRSPVLSRRRYARSRSPRPTHAGKRDRSWSRSPPRHQPPGKAGHGNGGNVSKQAVLSNSAKDDDDLGVEPASPLGHANGHEPLERVKQEPISDMDQAAGDAEQVDPAELKAKKAKREKKDKSKKAKKDKKKQKKDKKDWPAGPDDDKSSSPSGAEGDDIPRPAGETETLQRKSLEDDLRQKALLANKRSST